MTLRNWWQKWGQFVVFLVVGVGIRFLNFEETLYFTYDQGRDLYAISRILAGDLTLIGPTTGIEGFFTGPFWYYAGLPGILFGGGNPYIASAWYVCLACVALPFYWYIAHKLFAGHKGLALFCAYALTLVPGSITASLQIWNPLLVLPLVAMSTWLLFDAEKSLRALLLAFLALGLGLHAEFASVAFILAPLYLIVGWLRKKQSIKEYVGVTAVVGMTLLPQIIFEFRHQFLMTKSLWAALSTPQATLVPWGTHLVVRSEQLFAATSEILSGETISGKVVTVGLLVCFFVGLKTVFSSSEKVAAFLVQQRQWQLIAFLAVIPYPLYFFWRGNNGYFWNHYLTSQFLFLIPLIILGWYVLYKTQARLRLLLIVLLVAATGTTFWHLNQRVFAHENQAGLSVMNRATSRIYEYIGAALPPTVLVYTPNVYTDHYRYVLEWQANKRDVPIPLYTRNGSEQEWFVLIEPDYQIPERIEPWYYEATKNGSLVSRENIGHLTLERWQAL